METLAYITRYILPVICIAVAVFCLSSLIKTKSPKVTPAVFVDNLNGKQYPVTHWETSIGRSNSCDVVIDMETVSRFHAVLAKQKKGWVLTDTFSRTGTYINGEKITEPTVIKGGDTVIFGGASLTFRER